MVQEKPSWIAATGHWPPTAASLPGPLQEQPCHVASFSLSKVKVLGRDILLGRPGHVITVPLPEKQERFCPFSFQGGDKETWLSPALQPLYSIGFQHRRDLLLLSTTVILDLPLAPLPPDLGTYCSWCPLPPSAKISSSFDVSCLLDVIPLQIWDRSPSIVFPP